MSDKWNMIVDIEKCVGCYNCFLACKDEYVDNEEKGYFSSHSRHGAAALNIKYVERGSYPDAEAYYIPVMCNHCDDAPCMKADQDGAIIKRADGIVLFDPVKAKGKKHLANSCPYGAIQWNEEEQLPQTWIFDAHLLDRGYTQPRCVDVCPTGALSSLKVSDENMQKVAKEQGLETLLPKARTSARVYYRNYHKTTACFVSGSTMKCVDDVIDALEGVCVKVLKDNDCIGETISDAFGDFKISNLPPNFGECEVTLELDGAVYKKLHIQIEQDPINIGTQIIK